MGLGAGGRMVQKLYPDPFGVDTWDTDSFGRCSSTSSTASCGGRSPASARRLHRSPERRTRAQGYPWFSLYDEHLPDIPASKTLGAVKSVDELDATKVSDGRW